jgi:cyanuric acid amidohydrolase
MIDIEIGYPEWPGDAAPLAAWLGRLPREAVTRLVLLGKTEGPATLNDYSRDLAQAATARALDAAGGDLRSRCFCLFSAGCEGIATPLTIMIARIGGEASQARGLAVGAARSAPLPPSARCGLGHIDAAALTVREAMADAGLRPDAVALVLIKSPVLMPDAARDAAGAPSRHAGSTGAARGAAAIGAGIALDDIDRARLGADPVGRDRVFATRTMAFSGTETDCLEAIVLGERPGGDPRWSIRVATLADLVDADGMARLRAAADAPPQVVLFKAGIADGRLRGRRTTVLTSELAADKQLRAAASGLVGAYFASTAAFISGGAEHQAPLGGCLCAVLYRRP